MPSNYSFWQSSLKNNSDWICWYPFFNTIPSFLLLLFFYYLYLRNVRFLALIGSDFFFNSLNVQVLFLWGILFHRKSLIFCLKLADCNLLSSCQESLFRGEGLLFVNHILQNGWPFLGLGLSVFSLMNFWNSDLFIAS